MVLPGCQKRLSPATFTLLRWNGKYHKTTKIFHIHGTNDRSFPLKLTTPDMSVKGGHIITLTNTNEVNNFIANKIKFSRIV
jgi:tRNA(His) 5'-end guanylyltransferase